MSKTTWTKDKNGELNTTKVWRHVAFATATYLVVFSQSVPWELLLVYLAVVSGSEVAKKALEAKYPSSKEDPK